MQDNLIIIDELEITDDRTISCKFKYPVRFKKYFKNDRFTVTYDSDINHVPKSVLYIPAVANLAPVAWALGLNIKLPQLDEVFLAALDSVRESLRCMYPRVNLSGEVLTESINNIATGDTEGKTALLFSGGLDSLATYVLHEDEEPLLVTIWGADVKLDRADAWELVKLDNESFGKRHGRKSLFIKANIRDFLNEQTLNNKFGNTIGAWWAQVQHGLGLLGLCAPFSFAQGIRTIYIASSHTERFAAAWGSHPLIDNNVRWSGTTVVHDAYELTRQQKVGVIADFIRQKDPKLGIRACYSSLSGDNCSRCEKCSRTMVGLLVEGINPNAHGFVYRDGTLSDIRDKFNSGGWALGENEVFMWNDIRDNYIGSRISTPGDSDSFFRWLVSSDFERYRRKSESNTARRLKRLARRLPTPIVNKLRQFKSKS